MGAGRGRYSGGGGMGIERAPGSYKRQQEYEAREEKYWARRTYRPPKARWKWSQSENAYLARIGPVRLRVTRLAEGQWQPQIFSDSSIQTGPVAGSMSEAQAWCVAGAATGR
jgi:hypothetical protein